MLRIFNYSTLTPEKTAALISRNADSDNSVGKTVEDIIARVRKEGDAALFSFAETFESAKLSKLYLDEAEIADLAAIAETKAQTALRKAYENIHCFHTAQLKREEKIETMSGVLCWREDRAIERVGLYVPGGSAVLPSTFLMLGIPAKLAGCEEIVVCTPGNSGGKVNPYVAYCAKLLGIKRIYLIGGAQAVAAMAFGTETVPKTDKIFGPGNQYVTKAKILIQQQSLTAIDMPAGPSEVLVIADVTARPAFVAADLLAQCEHGADSQAVLVCNSSSFIEAVNIELSKQLELVPRKEIAQKALAGSYAILTENLQQAMDFSNAYAPEHLILETDSWEGLVAQIKNAGSVFLGHHTPESAGDYASGTNHTLPTAGYARMYSGVSVDSFVKKITFQHISKAGLTNLGPTVETLAALEGLEAHAEAVRVRIHRMTGLPD